MTDTDPWWPEGYGDDPAFQVRRQVYGAVTGGDYVRAQPGFASLTYLNPEVGQASTPHTADMNLVNGTKYRMTYKGKFDQALSSYAYFVVKETTTRDYLFGTVTGNNHYYFSAVTEFVGMTSPVSYGVDHTIGIEFTPGSIAAVEIFDGVRTNRAFNQVPTFTNTTAPVRVGDAVYRGRIDWAMLEQLDAQGNVAAVIWRFDPNDYPGTGTTYTDPRGRVWTLTNAAAIPPRVYSTTLQHTALRYPTDPTAAQSVVEGKAILYLRPFDHTTIEIQWGWPPMLDLTWLELALVRSSYGRPSTVNDGMTVVRWPRELFTNDTPIDDPPPIIYDKNLPSGRFYNYGLFFRVDQVNWVKGMVNSCLLPRDLGHHMHLWNRIPPYYQWTDNNMAVDSGPLRKFLSVFGFELDNTREFVEQWQHVYDIDRTPSRLLRHIGENFGLPFEAGIGEIRYRSLLTRIGDLYERRGTARCLEEVIEKFSKYECNVSAGNSLMLQPDDSDFYVGIGNWAGIHPDTVDPGGTVLTPDKVIMQHNTLQEMTPPSDFGRGSMRVYTPKANETAEFSITCGDGISYTPTPGVDPPDTPREIRPKEAGVPVHFGNSYGFSVCVQAMKMPLTVTIGILWFSAAGDAKSLVGSTLGTPAGVTLAGWNKFVVEGTVPAVNVVYAVPYINVADRLAGTDPTYSPYIHVAGAMVYRLSIDLGGVTVAPDRFLTLGDPGEEIGGRLTFKGTLSGAGQALPTGAALYDAWLVGSPVPTAIPQYQGITPARAAATGDAIYWNGTAWRNIGPTSNTFTPFILGRS